MFFLDSSYVDEDVNVNVDVDVDEDEDDGSVVIEGEGGAGGPHLGALFARVQVVPLVGERVDVEVVGDRAAELDALYLPRGRFLAVVAHERVSRPEVLVPAGLALEVGIVEPLEPIHEPAAPLPCASSGSADGLLAAPPALPLLAPSRLVVRHSAYKLSGYN